MRSWMVMGVLFVVGCGGGGSAPELFGMYQVDSHTESVAGAAPATCDGEGPAVTPAYLQLSQDDFTEGLAWALCDSADPGSCDQPDFYTFDDLGGVWEIGAATSASYSGGGCTLFHAEGGVTEESSDPISVRLELKVWDEFQTISESQCTLDAADALADQDACDRHVVIVATRI
ncbi:MAG TPA: hypothetical protein VL172_22045 [Kofleriaceae bacterium]|nr:hypothetical protein [Kofleriaceae bacterium]